MTGVSRTRRIGEQLKQEISLLIRKEVRDARAVMVSVTMVDVVRDLSQAKVLVTYLGPLEDRLEVMQALKDQAGTIRSALGKLLRLRTIPKLFFIYDEQLEKASALSNLINQAVAKDAQVAKARGDIDLDPVINQDIDQDINIDANLSKSSE
ncbi:hypothetical protein AwWohl_10110 [Gammaproteobacteria bacterium]|nr:hypothetical protein AwWohl_10110 [Gammaproteobacteria bacterium]